MRDEVVDLGRDRYAVIDFGGEGPDVLLVHDLISTAEIWRPFGDELAGFCHGVAVDLCGHGRTAVEQESVEALVSGLPRLVEELGLHRPLVVLGQEELIGLFEEAWRQIDPRGVLVAFAASSYRGEEARRYWSELLGPDALEGWVQRARLFACGAPGTSEEFVEERVAAAREDWVNRSVAEEQLRRYFRRQIRTTPSGWERVPSRGFLESVLRRVQGGVFGLDLLDLPQVPLWALVSADVADGGELDRFEEWASERPGRRVESVDGAIAIDGLDPRYFAGVVHDLLTRTES